MKAFLAIAMFLAAFSGRAQTVATTQNVLHPIMKDIHHPNGPTSLDRDPALKAELMNSSSPSRPVAHTSAQATAQPTPIVARIDSDFAASTMSVLGTVSGIKGKLYVTNIGAATVVPHVQVAVCDRNGVQIGSATKVGAPLGPDESERIEVLATNLNAADVKLMKLSGK